MILKKSFLISALLAAPILFPCLYAQEVSSNRMQYSGALKNAYFGLDIGHIRYPFSQSHLEDGFSADEIEIPHTAVRFILYGLRFNKYLSAQVSYMRPVTFARYNNVNGDRIEHNVWMTVGGLTLKGRLPVYKNISLEAEAGLGVVTRKGFKAHDITALRDASYATLLSGAAINWQVNRKWDLHLAAAWSPANSKFRQPQILFYSAGFNYNLREVSKENLERKIKSGHHFPYSLLYASITSNMMGYGVNDAVSKGPVPIFWGGEAHVKTGFGLHYQRNLFRSRKVFALDWGAGFGIWKSRDLEQSFLTLSVYPVLKFTALRTRPVDFVFEYSVAGPTWMSRSVVDHKKLGKRFTFQDFMGLGIITGKQRNLHAGLRIAHFSNGNIFTNNEGVKVPLTLNLGIALK